MSQMAESRLRALRLVLEDQIVREQDGSLHVLARGPLDPKVANRIEHLIRFGYATQTHGRIHATWKGAHAEHEQLYAQYVRKRDTLLTGTRRHITSHGAHQRVRKALAKLRAYEAAHPQFSAKPE